MAFFLQGHSHCNQQVPTQESHQQLTVEDIEEILCEAVIGEGISKVICR